ncbi:hypothetical protein BGW37DRAFT_490994 [Umbelopsis sp. PMI_123]|nr:hypothetical protein BGW37DRAFT_490994 [Umbelopsis sp. PMI_123]
MISPPSTKGRNNTDVGHVTKEEEITVYEEQQRTYPKELAVVLWDNVFQASPPAASNGGNTTAVQDSKPAAIRTPTLPDVYAPRPSLIRDSVMVTRTKEIDRYRVLYKIKYDNRKSKDSWLTMDGRLSIRTSKTGIPRIKQRWHEYVDRKNQLPGVYVKQRKTPKGQYFFWSGFACPLIWVIGSWYLEKTPNSADDMWRRRCSRASMIAGVAIVCGLVVFFVLHPSIFVPRMSFKPPIGTKVYGVE